jgi:TolA-binding protein
MAEDKSYLEMNPLTKAIVSSVFVFLTTLAASTWNNVQSTTSELIRLQEKMNSLNESISYYIRQQREDRKEYEQRFRDIEKTKGKQ